MEQYISKSALVAKIRNKVDSYKGDGIISIGVLKQHCEDFIYSLDTLEVKEVYFEKYYHDFLQKEWFGNSHVRTVSEMMAFTAKHFFELGMAVSNKPQKGE